MKKDRKEYNDRWTAPLVNPVQEELTMLKVKLTKVKSTHNNLRTNTVEGHCTHAPSVGTAFSMFAKPLETSSGFRGIQTSLIKEVTYNKSANSYIFTTQNSTYLLEVLEDKDPKEYERLRIA